MSEIVDLLALLISALLSSKLLFLICIPALVHLRMVQHGAGSIANHPRAESLVPASR